MAKVVITITCDWDAADYKYDYTNSSNQKITVSPPQRFKDGIQAILDFNTTFSGTIPITHFICPAYFTRSTALTQTYKSEIQKIQNQTPHEIGLHIHCWMSLMKKIQKKSGITLKDPQILTPKVADWGGLTVDYTDDSLKTVQDYGHGVPLGEYSQPDIEKILEKGKDILDKHLGLKSCDSFRCGGWMTCDNVFKALKAKGFKYEASAVDASFWYLRNKGTLDMWLAQLWGSKLSASPAYLQNSKFNKTYTTISTIPTSYVSYPHTDVLKALKPIKMSSGIVEIPDTGFLADYVNQKWMETHIDEAVTLARKDPSDIYISLGFHLESGGDQRPGQAYLKNRLTPVLQYANTNYAGDIEYATISGVGSRF